MLKDFFSNDPFGVNRYAAHAIVEDLLDEAWTPERKEEIIQRMKDRKADLIEHVQAGDYDLALWHYNSVDIYAVSLNSGQEDPTSVEGQEQKPKAQILYWTKVEAQLRQWIRQYGKLLIGSAAGGNTERYRRLLSRNFLIGDWKEYPRAGFFILPD